jgi:arylformamidase
MSGQMSTAAAIWREYDQAALDAQYNNRKRFPDYIDRFAAWGDWSQGTRNKLKCRLDVAFGAHHMESLDIFPAEQSGAPIYVFIHGGYWYSLDKSEFSYVAEGMVPHGVTTVVNNYVLAPNGNMDEIVRQNRAALAWIWRNATDFGADPDRIYVTGHSAGGHLAGMLLATDWPKFEAGLPRDLVKGACSISGLFELEPIWLSYLNQKLRMDREMAKRNSPALLEFPTKAPLLLVVGKDESDEYHRQSKAMADKWSKLGYEHELIVPEGLDHFAVVDSLIDPRADLVQRQLNAMPR